MDVGRVAKSLVAFAVGMLLFGGLIYWSSLDSLNNYEAKNLAIVEVHTTETNCRADDCKNTEYVYQTGKYTGNNDVSLSKSELAELKALIESSDFSTLIGSDSRSCPSVKGGNDISFTFPTKEDPTWYAPCSYTNTASLPVFKFLTEKLNLPSL